MKRLRSPTASEDQTSPAGMSCSAVTMPVAPTWQTCSRVMMSLGPHQRQVYSMILLPNELVVQPFQARWLRKSRVRSTVGASKIFCGGP